MLVKVRREDASVVRSHPSLFPSVCQFEARRQCLVVSSSVYPSTKRKNYCASDELAVRQDHITPDINLQKNPMRISQAPRFLNNRIRDGQPPPEFALDDTKKASSLRHVIVPRSRQYFH